jgi:hypothetical protein
MSDCAIPSIRLLFLWKPARREWGFTAYWAWARTGVWASLSRRQAAVRRGEMIVSRCVPLPRGNAPVLIRGPLSAAEVSRDRVTGSLPMLRYR